MRGQVGLFPDNFVEVIGAKNENQDQESHWHEVTSVGGKSSIRHSHQMKKSEKAHVRKSLDTRNAHSSNISGKHFVISNIYVCVFCFRDEATMFSRYDARYKNFVPRQITFPL